MKPIFIAHLLAGFAANVARAAPFEQPAGRTVPATFCAQILRGILEALR
jgi:hypothetical protein